MKQIFEKSHIQKLGSKLTFQNSWKPILEDINNDVLFSGKPLDTLALVSKIRKSFVLSLILVLPGSMVLGFYFSPIFLGLNLIPLLIFVYPKIHQSNLGKERKKKIEEELPSFVIFASVLQDVGVSLYDSFNVFGNTGMFKAVSQEGFLLKRNVEYFGLSQMEALEELGRTHKSESLKNLLLGYTSIWRSGGDLSLYLEGRAEEFFVGLKERYQKYTTSVGTIVEMLVTLLIILPIMIMVASFVLPGSSMEQITLLATVGLPMFSIVMAIAITSVQPSSFNDIGLKPKILVPLTVLGFGLGGVSYWYTQEVWIAISLGVIIPSAISAIITGKQNSEIIKSEQALPQFLRDMTEYKKIGYDVVLAAINLSKENLYNSKFELKLKELAVLLDNGIPPITSTKDIYFRSWFTKISFYLLGHIAEFGGGSPKTLETISRFITNAKQIVKEGKSSISMLTVIIFAAPIIMAFTASMLLGILGSFDTPLLTQQNNLDNQNDNILLANTDLGNLVTITPEFLSMVKTLIITSSLLSAFVITKAIDFTYYTTWRVVVIGIISVASIFMMDNLDGLEFSFESVLGDYSFSG